MPTHAPEASADYITLHGTHTSVVLEVRPHEAPLWRYWCLRSACLTAHLGIKNLHFVTNINL
jgi:hypothetical protein